MSRVFEDYEGYPKKACGKKHGSLEHVVELERITVRF